MRCSGPSIPSRAALAHSSSNGSVRFAHAFETALDLIRSDRLAPSGPVLKTMLRSSDALADLVKAARTGADVDEERTNALIEELRSFLDEDPFPTFRAHPGSQISLMAKQTRSASSP